MATKDEVLRRIAGGLGFLVGVAVGCPLAYVGFVLGGSLGIQLFDLVGVKGRDELALVIGGVLTGAIALLVAYGLARGLTRLLEKAFGTSSGARALEAERQ